MLYRGSERAGGNLFLQRRSAGYRLIPDPGYPPTTLLFECRKPRPMGVVRVQRLCQVNTHMLQLCEVVPTTRSIGVTYESF